MRQLKLSLLVIIGALAVVAALAFPMFHAWKARQEVRAACEKRVSEAYAKAQQAIEINANAFAEFIASRKSGANQFSENVTSWYGEWIAVKAHLPFTDKESHGQYIAEQFDQNIFTKSELGDTMKRSIEGAIKDMEGIENDLAVQLRQEILGRELNPSEQSNAKEDFEREITNAINDMRRGSERDVVVSTGKLVTSELASQVARLVVGRLAGPTAVLTLGAGDSWWTFGASELIGVAVYYIWNWIDDPREHIEKEVSKSLDQIGIEGRNAIQLELNQFLEQRAGLWRKAVDEAVKAPARNKL